MRIEKLHLNNVGAFKDVEIEFPAKKPDGKAEIHLFTGENGTGKSTVLYALAAGFYELDNIRKRFRRSNAETAEVRVQFSDGDYSTYTYDGINQLKHSFNSATRNASSLNFWQTMREGQVLIENRRYGYVQFAYSGGRKLPSPPAITKIGEIDESPFLDALSFNAAVNTSTLANWITLNRYKELLAGSEKDGEAVKRYNTALSLIEETVSALIERKVRIVIEREPIIAVQVELDGVKLDFDVLADGVKSILSWVADLFMRLDRMTWTDDRPLNEREFALFLDEIEVHLHPKWQWKILPAVQKLFPKAQIFIATHSPFVAASVEGAWIYKFRLDNDGNAQVEKPEYSQRGESVGAVLNEFFDVKEEFDPETEALFKKFYISRDNVLRGETGEEECLKKYIRQLLALNSLEVGNIVGFELAQLRRILKRDIAV